MELYKGWEYSIEREGICISGEISSRVGTFFFPSHDGGGGEEDLKFKPNETELLIRPTVTIALNCLMAGAMSLWVSVPIVPSTVPGTR